MDEPLASNSPRADWHARLLATTRDAVICIDRQGVIVLFNRAAEQMFGYSAEEAIGSKVTLLMAEPYAAEHDQYIERYERTNQPHAIGKIRSVAARRKGGEVFPIELSVTEVDGGGPTRYGAFIRDISEKLNLQQRLLDGERLAAIGTTAATFAHEIGNPLNGMAMHAQLLERWLSRVEPPLDERVHASVGALLGETRRLSHLLAEFRALARRHQISAAPTDLVHLVTEMLVAQTPSLNARSIRVEQDLPDTLRASLVDGEKIRQVLLNLINNAVDAMPGGGVLRVSVRDLETRVRVEVCDNGCGMPAHLDPFEPFVTSKPEGTGLGLPVALQIVQAHGGTLDHEPVAGGGTRLLLELPRRDRVPRDTPAR